MEKRKKENPQGLSHSHGKIVYGLNFLVKDQEYRGVWESLPRLWPVLKRKKVIKKKTGKVALLGSDSEKRDALSQPPD